MKSISEFIKQKQKTLLLILGVILLVLVIIGVAQLFRDRRVVKQTDTYTIEYDRSDDAYIVTSNQYMTNEVMNEINNEIQELCEGKDKSFDECVLVDIPGVLFGASEEELQNAELNKIEREKALQEIRDGKGTFDSYNQTPTDID